MSDVEMVIRLIDGSPAEQAAIEAPPPTQPRASQGQESQSPASVPPPGASDAPNRSTARTADQSNQPSVTGSAERFRDAAKDASPSLSTDAFDASVQAFGTFVDKLLSEAISPPMPRSEQGSEPATRGGMTEAPIPSRPRTTLDSDPVSPGMDFIRWAQQKLESRFPFARTIADRFRRGREATTRVAGYARRWANQPSKSRIGSAARSVVSRILGPAPTQAATQATARAATVAATSATGAAASGGAAAGGSAVAATSASVAPIAIAAGAVVASFAAVAVSAKLFNDAMVQAADSVEKFSPEVSLARDRRRMTTELNMLERSQRIGNQVGRFEDVKSRLIDEGEQTWTSILEALTALAPIAEKMIEIETAKMSLLRLGVDKVNSGLSYLKVLPSFFSKDRDWKQELAKQIKESQTAVTRTKISAVAQIMKALGLIQSADVLKPEVDPMLQGILDAEFDDNGNLKPKK